MVFKLLMIIMLNGTDTRAMELGYHDSIEDCKETAHVIGMSYHTKENPVEGVLYMCIPYEEV